MNGEINHITSSVCSVLWKNCMSVGLQLYTTCEFIVSSVLSPEMSSWDWIPFAPPSRYLWTRMRSAWAFSRLNSLSSLHPLTGEVLHPPHTFMALWWTLTFLWWSLSVGPSTAHSTPVSPHRCWAEGKDHCSLSAGSLWLPNNKELTNSILVNKLLSLNLQNS